MVRLKPLQPRMPVKDVVLMRVDVQCAVSESREVGEVCNKVEERYAESVRERLRVVQRSIDKQFAALTEPLTRALGDAGRLKASLIGPLIMADAELAAKLATGQQKGLTRPAGSK